MKIYRVHYYTWRECSSGYNYYDNELDAKAALRAWENGYGEAETDGSRIDVFEYPATREGMIRALNRLGSHSDNG